MKAFRLKLCRCLVLGALTITLVMAPVEMIWAGQASGGSGVVSVGSESRQAKIIKLRQAALREQIAYSAALKEEEKSLITAQIAVITTSLVLGSLVPNPTIPANLATAVELARAVNTVRGIAKLAGYTSDLAGVE